MKRFLNKAFVILAALLPVFMLASCGLVQKDVLYEYSIPENSSSSGKTTAVVENYDILFTGNLLAYNYWRDISVYTSAADTDSSQGGYEIFSYQGDVKRSVSVSANRFSSASASERGEVYFSERDASNTEYIYKSDSLGEKRVLMAKGEAGKSVVWCVGEINTFAYIDQYNRLVTVSESGQSNILYEIPAVYQISKIRYCEDDGIIMMIANFGNGYVNNLYRIDLQSKVISAVDVYVNAMSVVTSADKTAYLKIDSQGQKQLYVYDHNTLMREYIISGNIERFTLSPYGGYIAYSVRPQEGGNGSVWIINTRNFTNVQITANTTLASEIYWSSSERELIFTQNETNPNLNQMETVYRTYRLKFNYEYTEE